MSLVARLQAAPAKKPIARAAGLPTKPAAGVMAAHPAMTPEQKPIADHLCPRRQSRHIQVMPATDADRLVLTMAETALRFAARALPPLNLALCAALAKSEHES